MSVEDVKANLGQAIQSMNSAPLAEIQENTRPSMEGTGLKEAIQTALGEVAARAGKAAGIHVMSYAVKNDLDQAGAHLENGFGQDGGEAAATILQNHRQCSEGAETTRTTNDAVRDRLKNVQGLLQQALDEVTESDYPRLVATRAESADAAVAARAVTVQATRIYTAGL